MREREASEVRQDPLGKGGRPIHTASAGARELFQNYRSVVNAHDFDLIAPLLADECTFWFTSGTHCGVAAARAAFEKTWAMIAEEVYTLSDVVWVCEGDAAAACSYQFQWTGLVKGERREGRGRGTSCFQREAGGWKLVHEHLSALPAS